MTAVAEVLKPGEPTLGELAETINREHAATETAVLGALGHALAAGEALLAARSRCENGRWRAWCEENLTVSPLVATTYCRLARFSDVLASSNVTSIEQARRLLIGLPSAPNAPVRVSDETRDVIRHLRDQGLTIAAIAEEIGISQNTVGGILNPSRREKAEATERKRLARLKQERQREKQETVNRAVRKAAKPLQEAYAMAERFQDVIAQAQRATEDREARAALSVAGEHSRKMRDEIIKALGVS